MKRNRVLPSGVEVEFEGGVCEEVTAHAGLAAQ